MSPECGQICGFAAISDSTETAAAFAAYNTTMIHRRLPILLASAAFLGLLVAGWAGIGSGNSGQPAIAAVREQRRPVVLVYETSPRPSPAAGAWIWRASANGAHPKRLIRGRTPLISPDGRTIAFTRIRQINRGGGTSMLVSLWLMGSTGRHARSVIRDADWFGPFAWAPDSRHVVVGDSSGLRLVDRSNDSVRLLRGTAPTSTSGIQVASFSPDSRSIVYDRSDTTGSEIFALSISGGLPKQLTHDHKSFEPLWGPSEIAYVHGRGNLDSDIWLMDGDGTHVRRLTSTAAGFFPAAWSRGGDKLLGANPAIHNGRLWAVELPSGDARPLTKWVGDLFAQGLSRDGRTVYAAIGCGGTVSSRGLLEAIPFSGGPPKMIVRGPCRGSWSW
jgi:dipeptidyl aminopeptidase/acylaminoacyl peptidase